MIRIGILSKHLGEGEEIEIGEGDDKDKILIKPLTTDSIPLFFKAMKSFSGASGKDASIEDTLKNINDEGLGAIKELIDRTLAISLPSEPEEDRKAFGMKYMMVLLPKIMELNMQVGAVNPGSEEHRKQKAIEKFVESRSKPK